MVNAISVEESRRLKALKEFGVLDSLHEPEFDDIVKLAAQICDVPIALISFIDEKRLWIKACFGVDVTETTREDSFCTHTIQGREMMIVEDATQDPRFRFNPFVTGAPGVRFYAGIPLIDPSESAVLGAVCVIGLEPRTLTRRQIEGLTQLSRLVMAQLELRKSRHLLDEKERLMRNIIERLPVAVFCKDSLHNFEFVLWNREAEECWGIKSDRALGKTDYDLFQANQADSYRKEDIETLITPINGRPRKNLVSLTDRQGIPRYLLGYFLKQKPEIEP